MVVMMHSSRNCPGTGNWFAQLSKCVCVCNFTSISYSTTLADNFININSTADFYIYRLYRLLSVWLSTLQIWFCFFSLLILSVSLASFSTRSFFRHTQCAQSFFFIVCLSVCENLLLPFKWEFFLLLPGRCSSFSSSSSSAHSLIQGSLAQWHVQSRFIFFTLAFSLLSSPFIFSISAVPHIAVTLLAIFSVFLFCFLFKFFILFIFLSSQTSERRVWFVSGLLVHILCFLPLEQFSFWSQRVHWTGQDKDRPVWFNWIQCSGGGGAVTIGPMVAASFAPLLSSSSSPTRLWMSGGSQR